MGRDRPGSSLTLESAVPEAAAAFQKGNIFAVFLLLLSPQMPHSGFQDIWGFLPCFKKSPMKERKIHLEYSLAYSFASKLILLQSYLPRKDSAFTTGKILFSWNFLLFLGQSEYWQIMWRFLMKISWF